MNDREVIDPPMQKTTNAIHVSLENAQQIPNKADEARDVHARKVGPFFTPAFYHPRMKKPPESGSFGRLRSLPAVHPIPRRDPCRRRPLQNSF
jgi:hypothetical protein